MKLLKLARQRLLLLHGLIGEGIARVLSLFRHPSDHSVGGLNIDRFHQRDLIGVAWGVGIGHVVLGHIDGLLKRGERVGRVFKAE